MSKRKQEIDYAEPAAEGLSAKCQDIETKVNLMQQIKTCNDEIAELLEPTRERVMELRQQLADLKESVKIVNASLQMTKLLEEQDNKTINE